MYDNERLNELERLHFENFLWIIFGILCFMNVYGDFKEEEYLITNDKSFENQSNTIFEFTLIITFFIYVYFFTRNYKFYKEASENEKSLYCIKVFGSSLLIAGIICLIYFQTNQTSFVGAPAI